MRLTPRQIHCAKGETMTREARMMSGIILITVPTIQYGGYFFTPEEADWHRQRSQIKATVEKSGETKVRAERKYSSKKLAAPGLSRNAWLSAYRHSTACAGQTISVAKSGPQIAGEHSRSASNVAG